MLYCNKCKNKIVMNAFCDTECKICQTKITTGHMPGHVICKECSEKDSMCVSCGDYVISDKWDEKALMEFNNITNDESSKDQMDRIHARMAFNVFKRKYSTKAMNEMKEELVLRGMW